MTEYTFRRENTHDVTRAPVTFTDGTAVNFRVSYTFSGSGRATGAVRSIPLLAPLRRGAMSDSSPECTPKRTSADRSELMGSRRTPRNPALSLAGSASHPLQRA
jgi:hypothetical protein